jgi:hypothetical protein
MPNSASGLSPWSAVIRSKAGPRWTVRWIAEEPVKPNLVPLVPKVGRETMRILLLSHEFKLWRKKMWSMPELNEEYIARMEDILEGYEKPCDPKEPVIRLEEKSVTLHADVRPIFRSCAGPGGTPR